MNLKRLARLFRSKTVWAGIVGAAGMILGAPEIDADVIMKAGATIFGAIGVRDAILKSEK